MKSRSALVLILAAGSAGVQADPLPTERTFLDEVPVVLSAARLVQPLRDAPGAVSVIDRAMIRASGAREVVELLQLVPGFQIARKSGAAALSTYHGLSDDAPRRMLVRVDGRSAYSPYFISGIEWAKISVDIDDIERIEVFRGSNAAAYGSNAFLGVVNIITRPAADTPRARLRVTEGDNGLSERVASFGARFGRTAARLTLARSAAEGLDPIADDFRHQRADARIDWQLATDHQLEFHLGFVDSRVRTGVAGELTDPPRDTDAYTGFGQLRWRHQLGLGEELRLTYFHQEERFEDEGFFVPSVAAYLGVPPAALAIFGMPPNAFVDADNDTRAIRDDLEFDHELHPGPRTRLVWGAGLRHDRVTSMRVFDTLDEQRVRQSRLFGNLEWRPSAQWTFNAGALLEDTDAVGPRLSPRLAANWHLGEATTLRAAASRGYRNLAPYERRADIRYREALSGFVLFQAFQPSGRVTPERVDTVEAGLRQEWSHGRSSIDLRVYREEVRDMLRRITTASNVSPAPPLNNSGEAPTYVGGGRADIRGAELAAICRPGNDTWIGGHYAYVDINSNDEFADASAPRHSFALFAAAALPGGWQVSAHHGFVGSMQWYTQDEDRVSAYHHTALRLARRFSVAAVDGEIALGVERLDDAVADYLPTLTRPRQGYASLRLAF